ncbi:hypothetical protein GGR52DRAFT_488327 [Hypoxylon sp. FL1284]|nr:hypothetical protein GGR52DRAFT_488327 [Hypoxylon sp. FL1284]
MLREQLDSTSAFDGENATPWGPRLDISGLGILAAYPTTSVFARNFDCKSLTMGSLDFDVDALPVGKNCGRLESEKKPAAVSSGDETPFPFMSLPLEIRLEVYRWIYLTTPIGPTQSKPWYRNNENGAYHVKYVTVDTDTKASEALDDTSEPESSETISESGSEPASESELLPARPNCHMPTAMLRASKQIYYESRELPFLENEFAFVNWFTSGPWAARSFMRGLRPWQRDAMRHARLELLSRDLSDRFAREWTELCRHWSPGLRGLRLKILNGGSAGASDEGGPAGGVFGLATTAAGGLSWAAVGLPQRDAPPVRVRDEEGNVEGWVRDGLVRLRQLRRLEVELAIADWDDATKLRWCRELEAAVNEARVDSEPRVRVACVEKED